MTELKIRIKSPLYGGKDNMIVETNMGMPDKDKETSNSSIVSLANTINCTISPFTIGGWLRHGITEYLISEGVSPCYNFDVSSIGKDSISRKNQSDSDLNRGYHMKGSVKRKPQCEESVGHRCIVSELFGDFVHPKQFSIIPIKITPIKDVYRNMRKNVTGMGNYRRLSVSPRSSEENIEQNGAAVPFMTSGVDVIANLDAILYLSLYSSKKEKEYTGLIMKGIEYLNKKNKEFNFQLGGHRTFGCGFIESSFLPTELTGKLVPDYHELLINKEDMINNVDSMSDKITDGIKIPDKIKPILERWEIEKKEILETFNKELKIQKSTFPIDKKWIKIQKKDDPKPE